MRELGGIKMSPENDSGKNKAASIPKDEIDLAEDATGVKNKNLDFHTLVHSE